MTATDPALISSTFTIAAWKVDYVSAKLATIAKRCVRRGFTAPTMDVVRTFTTKDETGRYDQHWADVRVTGQRVHIEGWRVVANLVYVPAAGENIVRAADDAPDLTAYNKRHHCDHCGKKRNRAETWVLANDAGETKQVARSCVQDFIGGADIDLGVMAGWLDTVAMGGWDDEEWGGCVSGAGGVGMTLYLAWVAKLVDASGFVSKKKSREEGGISTAEEALKLALTPPGLLRKDGITWPSAGHFDIASKALAWIRQDTTGFGYLRNCRLACMSDFIARRDYKLTGLIASVVGAAYPRHLADVAKAEEKKGATVSKFVGKVKDRLDFILTVERVRKFETSYGHATLIATLIVMRCPLGNAFVWRASSDKDVKEGEEYEVRGTVKRHAVDGFSGEQTTYLTRCDLTLCEQASAA